MEKNNILFLIVGLLIGLIAIKAGPMIIMGFNTMNVTLTGTTGNTGPSVDTVTLNAGVPIDLNAGSTKSVICTSTVSDPNGFNDISTVTAQIYYKYYSANDVIFIDGNGLHEPEYSYAYTNDSPDDNGGYDTTKLDVTFTFDVTYQAVPGEWVCFVKVTDSSSATANLTDTETMNTLNSLDTDSTINFGALTVGTPSSQQTHAVRNWGNVMIDLALNGTDMTCSTLGSIPVADIKYDPYVSGTAYGSMTALSGSQTTAATFDLAKKTVNDTTTNSTRNTYWRVQAPSGAKGTCTGQAQFTSVAGDFSIGNATEVSGFTNGTMVFYSQNPTTNMYYRLVVDNVNSTNNDLKFYNSTDGTTWSSAVVVVTGEGYLETNSPVFILQGGDLGIVYSDNKTANNTYNVFFKKSTDNGATWSAAVQISDDSKNNTRPSAIVETGGEIHVVYNDNKPPGPVTLPIGNSDVLMHANSSDNGTTWNISSNSVVSRAIDPTLIRDSSDNLFVFYISDPSFGPVEHSLFVESSTDNGETWGAQAYVIRDTVYNKAYPSATVDKDGTIWVLSEINYSTTDNHIVYTRSYDNTTTWDVPIKLTTDSLDQYNPSVSMMNNGNLWVGYYNESGELARVVATY